MNPIPYCWTFHCFQFSTFKFFHIIYIYIYYHKKFFCKFQQTSSTSHISDYHLRFDSRKANSCLFFLRVSSHVNSKVLSWGEWREVGNIFFLNQAEKCFSRKTPGDCKVAKWWFSNAGPSGSWVGESRKPTNPPAGKLGLVPNPAVMLFSCLRAKWSWREMHETRTYGTVFCKRRLFTLLLGG